MEKQREEVSKKWAVKVPDSLGLVKDRCDIGAKHVVDTGVEGHQERLLPLPTVESPGKHRVIQAPVMRF
jgi:hypothetical protein